jgi:hypothetical protein
VRSCLDYSQCGDQQFQETDQVVLTQLQLPVLTDFQMLYLLIGLQPQRAFLDLGRDGNR